MVGRINGACATLRSTPLHYIHRSVSLRELVALYRAADVMLVTPLRDGMNLVAKEFVAAREDDEGVLVLSEFAGAAAELGDALIVNPYDVDALVSCIETALAMPADERRARMRRLRGRVLQHDVHAWARQFVQTLSTGAGPAPAVPPDHSEAGAVATELGGGPLTLLLDYDGTLVPIAATPELAAPDAELLQLLHALAARPGLDVHIVSGRHRDTLEEWLGGLPLTLWAEHGFWQRGREGPDWTPASSVPDHGWDKVLAILQHFAASTPGARVERKTASLAWHYRLADPAFGARQAHELRLLLGDALSNQPLEVLEGKMVIEVRVRGISKAAVVAQLLAADPDRSRLAAIGDDRTDEDMFAALPPSAVTVKVGPGPSRARFRVGGPGDVRLLLRTLTAGRIETPPARRAAGRGTAGSHTRSPG
jgi:trehalose 6-phosphate synthase/phosphatase